MDRIINLFYTNGISAFGLKDKKMVYFTVLQEKLLLREHLIQNGGNKIHIWWWENSDRVRIDN